MATANNGGTAERRETTQQKSESKSGELQTTRGPSRGGSLARPEPFEGLSPFGLMRRMFEEMDRLFEDPFGMQPFGTQQRGLDLPRGLWSPQIEVYEKDGKLMVRADLPGLENKDIQVNIEDDVLTVSGERKNEHEGQEQGVFRSERSYGRFERRIALPKGVDPNAIDAKFENGVLEISAPLPKQEQRGRKIDVKGASPKH